MALGASRNALRSMQENHVCITQNTRGGVRTKPQKTISENSKLVGINGDTYLIPIVPSWRNRFEGQNTACEVRLSFCTSDTAKNMAESKELCRNPAQRSWWSSGSIHPVSRPLACFRTMGSRLSASLKSLVEQLWRRVLKNHVDVLLYEVFDWGGIRVTSEYCQYYFDSSLSLSV